MPLYIVKDVDVIIEDYWEEFQGITICFYYSDSKVDDDLLDITIYWETLQHYWKEEGHSTEYAEVYLQDEAILDQRQYAVTFHQWWYTSDHARKAELCKDYIHDCISPPMPIMTLKEFLNRRAV